MSVEEKLITIAQNVAKVYDAGYTLSSINSYHNPLRFAKSLNFTWSKIVFPADYNIFLELEQILDLSSAFIQTSGIKTATIALNTQNAINMQAMFRESADLEAIEFKNNIFSPTNIAYFVYNDKKLKSILGTFDLTNCTNTNYAFSNALALENIAFQPKTILMNLDFVSCANLSHPSLISILEGLRDQNINIDIKDFQPDCAADNDDFAPGRYKITEVVLDPYINSNIYRYINLTTENGYHFRIAQQHCGDHWDEVLEGFLVGNYIEFDGTLKSSGYYDFDYLRIVSNPDGTTKTLTLGAQNLAKLSEEEKQIALNKGWVLK